MDDDSSCDATELASRVRRGEVDPVDRVEQAIAAIEAASPDAWRRGIGADPPAAVSGEHAHYGVARAAELRPRDVSQSVAASGMA